MGPRPAGAAGVPERGARMNFHELHRPGAPLLLPNAWDVASAKLFAAAGHAAVGTTSLGVAAAAGRPDGVGASRAETLALARLLAELPCPVTVDVEAGFSDDPAEVAGVAATLAGYGVAGINLEDAGGPPSLQVAKIVAIKAAAPGLFVNARTDTYWLGRGSYDETVWRLEAYVAAGADGVFVPGLRTPDTIRALVAAVDAPLNVLIAPDGPTVTELAGLGVARISCGSLLYRAALTAAVGVLGAVASAGPLPTDVLNYAEVARL
ncbi:isocitrate lyase/phosphoenolpyruvate mutase family protein [Polymorphospora sp. NPDC050346]|uniref:isocitrate lyase/PEP mutase family protein n=1 Tax=Polymorphospora sp. NPDC050346 TaxID=3155780 RepID=UPI00340D969A